MSITTFVNDIEDAELEITIAKVKEIFKHFNWKRFYKKHSRWIHNSNIHKQLKNLGFSLIGSGVSREVYGNNKYVVKIEVHGQDWGHRWLEQNKEELLNYFNLPEKAKDYFPKIYAYDNPTHPHWLVVERAKVDSDKDSHGIDWCEIVNQIKEIFDNLQIEVNDMHTSNVGLIGTRPVMIDYGFKDYFSKTKKSDREC